MATRSDNRPSPISRRAHVHGAGPPAVFSPTDPLMSCELHDPLTELAAAHPERAIARAPQRGEGLGAMAPDDATPPAPPASPPPGDGPWDAAGPQKPPFTTSSQLSRQRSGPEAVATSLPDLRQTGGSRLSPDQRARARHALGRDFAHVRIHRDAASSAAAEALSARAFAMGSHVWFHTDSPRPGNPAGDELLLHELAHVAQHTEGRIPRASTASRQISRPDDPHEVEATRVARAALSAFRHPSAPAENTPVDGAAAPASASAPISRGIVSDAMEYTADGFMSLVRRASPKLAELIEHGPDGLLRDAVIPAIEGWVGELAGSAGVGEGLRSLQDTLGSAFRALEGALTGDPAACKALAGAVQAIRDLASRVMESPAVQKAQAFLDEVSQAASSLFRLVAAPAFEAVKSLVSSAWEAVAGLASDAWGWISTVRDWLGAAYDWVLEKLGVEPGSGGILAWFSERVGHIWDEVKQWLGPLAGPIEALGKILLAISPLGPIYLIWTTAPQVLEMVSWLWAHRDDPNIVATAHEEMGHTALPRLLAGAQQVGDALGQARDWLQAQGRGLVESLDRALAAIGDVPIIRAARGLVERIAQAAHAIEAWTRDTFGPAVDRARQLAQRLGEWLAPIIGVLSSIGLALVNPAMIPVILAGWAWRALPDCYKGPIIDLLLDAATAVIRALPASAMLGSLWPIVQPGLLGFLSGVRSQPLDIKIKVSDKLARIISGASPALMFGFVKGLLKGLWEGLTDPFMLIWNVGKGLGRLLDWLQRVVTGEAEPAQAATSTVEPGSGDLGPAAPAAPAAPSRDVMSTLHEAAQDLKQPVGTVVRDTMPAMREHFASGAGLTFDGLIDKLRALWKTAQGAISSAGTRLAKEMCAWFTGDAAESQIGETMGWLVGTILFEVALGILTAGTWAAAHPALKALLRFLDLTGELLGMIGKLFRRLGKGILEGLKGLGRLVGRATGAMKTVLDAFKEIAEKLSRYADELLGRGAKETSEEAAEVATRKTGGEVGEEATEGAARRADDAPDIAEKQRVAIEAGIMSNALEAAGTPTRLIVAELKSYFMLRHGWIRDFIAEGLSGRYATIFMIASKVPIDKVDQRDGGDKRLAQKDVAEATETTPRAVPQGIDPVAFRQAGALVRERTGHLGGEVLIQGSRARGTARLDSDMDIAILVDPETFDQILKNSFKTPNPGSAAARTRDHAIVTGKIHARPLRLTALRDELEKLLGVDVDLSVIKRGGAFDQPPYVPM